MRASQNKPFKPYAWRTDIYLQLLGTFILTTTLIPFAPYLNILNQQFNTIFSTINTQFMTFLLCYLATALIINPIIRAHIKAPFSHRMMMHSAFILTMALLPISSLPLLGTVALSIFSYAFSLILTNALPSAQAAQAAQKELSPRTPPRSPSPSRSSLSSLSPSSSLSSLSPSSSLSSRPSLSF